MRAISRARERLRQGELENATRRVPKPPSRVCRSTNFEVALAVETRRLLSQAQIFLRPHSERKILRNCALLEFQRPSFSGELSPTASYCWMSLRLFLNRIIMSTSQSIASSSTTSPDLAGSLKRKASSTNVAEGGASSAVVAEGGEVATISREDRRKDKKRRKEELKAAVSANLVAGGLVGIEGWWGEEEEEGRKSLSSSSPSSRELHRADPFFLDLFPGATVASSYVPVQHCRSRQVW